MERGGERVFALELIRSPYIDNFVPEEDSPVERGDVSGINQTGIGRGAAIQDVADIYVKYDVASRGEARGGLEPYPWMFGDEAETIYVRQILVFKRLVFEDGIVVKDIHADEKTVVVENRERRPNIVDISRTIVFYEFACHGAVYVVEIQFVESQGSRQEDEIALPGQSRQPSRNLIGVELVDFFAELRGYGQCPRRWNIFPAWYVYNVFRVLNRSGFNSIIACIAGYADLSVLGSEAAAHMERVMGEVAELAD